MKDLFEKTIKENINKVVNDVISEESIHAKKRNQKNIKDALIKGKRGYNAVKCFAILTAQNSNSIKQSSKDNKKNNHSLLSDLRQGNYIVISTEGKFEQLENSYCVINISLDAVKHYCGLYEQSSFIYTTIGDDMLVNNQYWEKADVTKPYNKHTNDYICKDETSDVADMADADDYYTKVGNFKFSIPFSIFEGISRQIMKNIDAIVLHEGKRPLEMSRNRLLNWSIDRVGQSPYLYRKRLYKGLI